MARPKKQTVDYFPHMCNHKKTMYILEQKYGNDGYAFWFKLLEMLGSSDGHYLDFNNDDDWEFLQAKTRLGGDICTEILNLLAKLNAIDQELWSKKIVWSQNFIDNIEDVYRKTPNIPSCWYTSALKVDVYDDLDNNPHLLEKLGVWEKRFVTWCANQRVVYEADIFDEVKVFEEKFIKNRLYNTDLRLWRKISKIVFERDDYTCFYCGNRGGILEVDHVIPISKGGTNDLTNLITSCRRCNRQKKDKSVDEFYIWRLANDTR